MFVIMPLMCGVQSVQQQTVQSLGMWQLLEIVEEEDLVDRLESLQEKVWCS